VWQAAAEGAAMREGKMQEVATGYGLIEAPTWSARGLIFSDVRNGGVYRLGLDGKISTIVPKRRGVGGIALHAEGGLVIGGRDIIYVPDDGGPQRLVLAPASIPNAIGFNDLTVDSNGRIYLGSLAGVVFGPDELKPGNLLVIDLDGRPRVLSDGVILTNGVGFSPDGKHLYHSDSRSEHVRVYDVKEDGSVGPWRVFAQFEKGHVPDGLKVASDGSVWVADARGSRVEVFEASGKHRTDVEVPLPMVTSLCFGSGDLRDLYIVTGSEGGPRENCGTIYRTRVDVPGLKVPATKIDVAHAPVYSR
jgi:gluconolactonase